MNIFDLLGYRSDKPYKIESKTSVGYFALINGGSTHSYVLDASNGTYAVTGQTATFSKSVSIFASSGSYAITGKDAAFSLTRAYSLTGEYGTYAISGQDATFAQTTAYSLSAENGSYSITGQDAVLTAGTSYYLTAEHGTYVLSGQDANLEYQEAPAFVETRGGLPKAKSTKKYKEESELREELEKIVKEQFDKLDGTYVPEVVEKTKSVFIPEIKKIDLSEYDQAISQVNALLLQIKSKAAEYEAELDDEEAILMLL